MGNKTNGLKDLKPSQDSSAALSAQHMIHLKNESDGLPLERPRTVITLGMDIPFQEMVKSIRTFKSPDDGSECIEIDLSLNRPEGDLFLQMPLTGAFDRTFVDIIARLLDSRYVTINYDPSQPSREVMRIVIIEDDAEVFIHGISPKSRRA